MCKVVNICDHTSKDFRLDMAPATPYLYSLEDLNRNPIDIKLDLAISGGAIT